VILVVSVIVVGAVEKWAGRRAVHFSTGPRQPAIVRAGGGSGSGGGASLASDSALK
jgi:hypothetical protein